MSRDVVQMLFVRISASSLLRFGEAANMDAGAPATSVVGQHATSRVRDQFTGRSFVGVASGPQRPLNRQRFYKMGYQAILDYSGDQHLIATAIDHLFPTTSAQTIAPTARSVIGPVGPLTLL
jgi:hypothetical protein